ncbi:MAG: hypothetical protein GY765_31650, partial [bacterium]|nr:hypothetical protein [bacterium]
MRYIKQTAFVLFIMLFALTITVSAENAGNQMEVDVKRVLKRVSPSIVKVVAQNHKMHTATGVALAPDMVVSTLFEVKYPYDSIYV